MRDSRQTHLSRLWAYLSPPPSFVLVATIFILFTTITPVLHAADLAPPIHIEQEARTDISFSVYFFNEHDLDWQAVAGKPITEGQLNPGGFFNVDEFGGLPLWMRLDLTTGELNPADEWLLGLDNGFGGDMVLHLVVDGELIQETRLSSKGTFAERPHPNRLVHFPLNLPANKHVQLLLRIDSATSPFFIPRITTESLLTSSEVVMGSWLGFAFGLLATMMIYHLVLAAATLDKAYLTYSLYVGSNFLWMAIYRGVSFKFLWPNAPWFETHVGIILYYLPAFFAIYFAVQFLKLPSISRGLTRFYYGISLWLAFLVMLKTLKPDTNVALLSFTSLVIFFSFIYTGIYAMRKGVIYARFYLIAWTVYCLSIINWMLVVTRSPALFPESSYWIMIVAFDVQVMLLAIALAHRIRIMRNSKLEAEADNRAKSEFLARMSHEIRTPLSGVLGMAELLSDRLKDKTNLYYANIIRSSGTSLLTIINDILDYSKFTSGKMEMEKIPFSLQRLAVDSLDIFKVKAGEKNIELIVDLNLDMSPFVIGDPTRIKQVMLNFISNAIKFTNEGQIVLRINPVNDQPDMIRIAVTDSGEGISASDQKKLFEVFSQASNSTARKHGGTGLGLSICKQLAHLMEGDIGVESQPGKGSTFWITARLPASEEAHPIPNLSDIDLTGFNVLIVEDNYTFAELLQSQAKTWGMECCVARDGHDALTLLTEKHAQDIHFDLISLDLVMPKMDGLETSRRIQSDERFRDIPRLLLTSATNFPAQHALVAAGIKRVMEKPTLPADLKQIYKELLAKGGAVSEFSVLAAPVEQLTLPQLSILVAEDNAVNQMVISGILKRLKQSVMMVEHGEKALKAIQQGLTHFDLVLMDCDMPVMDGNTATKEIRAWERKHNRKPINIVALTAHAVQSQIDECFAAGMNEYLAKPIDIGKLEALLRNYASTGDGKSSSAEPLETI